MSLKPSRRSVVGHVAFLAMGVGCTNQGFEVGSVDATGSRGIDDVRGSSGGPPQELSSQLGGSGPSGAAPVAGAAPLAGTAPTAGSAAASSVGGAIATPTCSNGNRDDNETDVDCGGECAPCERDRHCGLDSDCISSKCVSTLCAPWPPSGAPLDMSDWVVTASDTYPDDDPAALLHPPPSRWISGRNQYAGMWLQIDMRQPQFFSEIDLLTVDEPSAAARFDVYTSLDGEYGKPVVAGVFGSPQTRLVFDQPQYARYIRLVLTQDAPRWWSITTLAIKQ